jgi:addiction module HigA family antidote
VTRPPIHPGELLAEELVFLDMTTSALARELDMPVSQLAANLNGERGITADIAQRLSGWLGTSPDLWLNLQSRYEVRMAEAGSRM